MKVLKWLDKYIEIIYLAIALAIIVVVMTMQIFSRKVMGVSLAWSEECCRHLFIGMGIWGIALTIRLDSAIKFDLILGYLPEKGKSVFGVIANGIMLCFFAFLVMPAYRVYVSMKTTSATMMPYNMNVVYGLVMIGIILVVIRAAQMFVINLKTLFGKAGEEKK